MLRLAALALSLALVVPGPGPGPGAGPSYVDPALRAAASADPLATFTVGLGFAEVPDEAMQREIRARGFPAIFYAHLPVAVAYARGADLERLLSTPGVLSAVLDVPAEPHALPRGEQGNFGGTGDSITRADRARALGFDGSGVGLAVLDLGTSGLHPGLKPRAEGGPMVQNVKVLVSPGKIVSNQPVEAPVTLYVENLTNSDWTDGHGTHTAGIAAGHWTADGLLGGRAPGADLVAIGAGDALLLPWTLGGLEWVAAHHEEYDIRILSNSWGLQGPFAPLHPIHLATKALDEMGILVIFSAGNNGPGTRTLNTYAQAPWVLAVGSTSMSGAIARSSARGDPASGKPGPDLVAPGVEVISGRNQPLSANEVTYRTPWTDLAYVPPEHVYWYRAISGTSMAAPQVAGIAALVLDANPDLTPAQLRAILTSTARPLVGYEVDAQGAGMVDAEAAVRAALGLDPGARDVVQPTVAAWAGDDIVYPFHGSLLGGPEKSASVFAPKHGFPVHQPNDGLRVRFAWDTPPAAAPDGVDGLVVTLLGADGSIVRRAELSGASGEIELVVDAAEAAARKSPRWSAAYWTVAVDLDAGLLVYDLEARVTYDGAALPPVEHLPPLPPPPLPPRVARGPIVIASDADLTAANGVVRGSGTVDDPFVIEGWDLTTPTGTGSILTLGSIASGLSKHVLIQNVRVHDTRNACVELIRVSNLVVRDSQFDGCDFSLNSRGGSNMLFERNEFLNSQRGPSFFGPSNVVVRDNLVSGMTVSGILVSQGFSQFGGPSLDVVVERNRLVGQDTIVQIVTPAAVGVVVRDNVFADGAWIDLQNAPALTVISGSDWLDGTQRIVQRILTTPNPAPDALSTVVDAGSDRFAGGLVCFADARADVPLSDAVLSLTWAFGDGGSASGEARPCHAYAPGTYVATLAVTVQRADGSVVTLQDDVRVR